MIEYKILVVGRFRGDFSSFSKILENLMELQNGSFKSHELSDLNPDEEVIGQEFTISFESESEIKENIMMGLGKKPALLALNRTEEEWKLVLNYDEGGELIHESDINKSIQQLEGFHSKIQQIIMVGGAGIALSIGDIKVLPAAIFGAGNEYFNFEIILWEKAIRKSVPPQIYDMYLSAFHAGRTYNSNRKYSK